MTPSPDIDLVTVTIIGAVDTSMLNFTSMPSHVEKLKYHSGKLVLNDSYSTSQLGLYILNSFDSIYYKNNLITKIVSYDRSPGISDSYNIKHIILPVYEGNTLRQEQYYDKELKLTRNVVYQDYSSTPYLLKYSSKEFEVSNEIQTLKRVNTHESVKINKVWHTIYTLTINQNNDTLLFTELDTIFSNKNCEVSNHIKGIYSLNSWLFNTDSILSLRYVEQIQGKNKYYQYVIHQFNKLKDKTKKNSELLLDIFVSKGPWVNEDINFAVEFRKDGKNYFPKAQILNRSKAINGSVADYRQLNKGGNRLFIGNGDIYSNVELGKVKFSVENILGNYILVLEPIDFQNSSIRLKSVSNQTNNVSKFDYNYNIARDYILNKYILSDKN